MKYQASIEIGVPTEYQNAYQTLLQNWDEYHLEIIKRLLQLLLSSFWIYDDERPTYR